ncbi:flagellar biosynthesis protein FlgD [Clostridium sp. cel8]|jgi:flagellar basal-body rod modification protein FlgD|uniref:flagellar hook capping FlgD N-terminal domain-containing protein n=1 Tax=Clostridium sp. cel8 TaxID=2663123 RepID=UPI0015F52BDE|nr:flagellar hook capping FlgD N-terminal domain-containing protein [Clostridium sp. cel8]MBA5850685.1 flagellar biosynthesis protein FlgD [Clostridium sp. cel8]
MAISVDNSLNENLYNNGIKALSDSSIYDENLESTSSSSRETGLDIDENMFLKILSAELANQDPTDSDGQSATQYVSQLAQFSALQQMLNLNETSKLNLANSLVNKYIISSDKDQDGNEISGIVTGTVKEGDDVYLRVLVGQESDSSGATEGKYEKVNIDDVTEVDDLGDTYNTSTNNMMLLTASSLIGKSVQTDQQDESGNYYSGEVISVSRSNGTVILNLKLSDGTYKEFDFNDISNIEN